MADKETIQQRKECAIHFQKIDDAIFRIDLNLNNHVNEITQAIKDLQKEARNIAEVVEVKLNAHNDKVDNQLEQLLNNTDKKYASKPEFKLVQKVVFGMIGAIVMAFLYELISSVIK